MSDLIKRNGFVYRIRMLDDAMYNQLSKNIPVEAKKTAVEVSETLRRCEKLCRAISPPDYSGL